MAEPAAFIDRDGVINEERGYVHRIEDFVLLPGALRGLSALQSAGYPLVVVTNQSGIGRGLYSEADYEALTRHMTATLHAAGIQLRGVYHCPHHPSVAAPSIVIDCDCRKPHPGLLVRAARELGLDLARSVLVGDKLSDIQAGRRAGLRTCVLVRSGHALTPQEEEAADACLPGLDEAAAWIVARSRPHLC
jgi:D-glycero-D-manno-heptose 1,7-bisphosphate phosphatase